MQLYRFEVGFRAKLVIVWIFLENFTSPPYGFETQSFPNILISLGIVGVFFISIVIHEFSHAITMTLLGIKVEKSRPSENQIFS